MTAAAAQNSMRPSGNGTGGSVPERRFRFAGRFVGWCRTVGRHWNDEPGGLSSNYAELRN